jgi:hypothetical protein
MTDLSKQNGTSERQAWNAVGVVEPLTAVWRTQDRLHTDDATIAQLVELAAHDPAITAVIPKLQAEGPGNGSVWASGTAQLDGTQVLLKLGARPEEREWVTAIDAAAPDIVPRVFGSGELRGVGWLVLERCETKLDPTSQTTLSTVIDSTARYQQAAATISAPSTVMDVEALRQSLSDARSMSCPGAIHQAIADLDRAWTFASTACGVSVNHGDVHLANVVARYVDGPALLIDPMPITTVWAYDAAYLEVVSGHPGGEDPITGSLGLVHELARARQAMGLQTADDLDRVERLVLGWVAVLWWRIAPWRHDVAAWRRFVASCIDGLRW